MGRRRKPRGLITDFASRNGLAHAYRSVYGEISRSISASGNRMCAVASARAGEGRTLAAINLAGVAARETGGRVLLIDADANDPSMHLALHVSAGPGLAEVVRDGASAMSVIRPVESLPGVSVMTAGETPPGSVALAESARIDEVLKELRAAFAWVIMDTSPILSSPGMARLAARTDGVVMAVRWSSTRSQIVQKACDKLEAADANVLGVVLTQRHFMIPSYIYRRL